MEKVTALRAAREKLHRIYPSLLPSELLIAHCYLLTVCANSVTCIELRLSTFTKVEGASLCFLKLDSKPSVESNKS